jgi:hypothetical protein
MDVLDRRSIIETKSRKRKRILPLPGFSNFHQQFASIVYPPPQYLLLM